MADNNQDVDQDTDVEGGSWHFNIIKSDKNNKNPSLLYNI